MSQVTTGPQLRGVNRAGAEYGEDWDRWTGQTFYEWPSMPVRTNELNAYAAKGMNVVRLPISWERVQHRPNGPLDPTYQAHLVDYVQAATALGFAVIIDLHSYGRYATGAYNAAGAQAPTYTQQVLGDGTLTFAHVADVWTKIATLCVSEPRVIFNLMTEQHDTSSSLDSTAIFAGYQTVVNAVRATGATQLILFPNTRSSDTHHWSTWSPQGGPLDAVAALSVTDSVHNLAFDMHSYTGTDSWNDDITVVTDWAHAHGKRLFLSEPGTTSGAPAVSTLLPYIKANADVWVGWTVWNLAPYAISVTDQSTGVVSDTPQMAWYAPYFAP
jgi:endoglucanase